ncbi:hypothetical protein [Parapedobacter sp. 2B3]|uniref:hypothetical protein n=1 Tax=Parapedobacter sp. 2B3 TaxID=3342381 RepID=UPI0035B5766B
MANLLVMYARGVWEFKYTGATPKNAYLNHLLATDGTVPANQIRFCYHYKHKINRIRLRGGEQRSDPIVDDTFKNMMERLDPEEFMEVRSGLIIHQTAIVDDGRMQRNGNRRVELVEPYEKYDKSGDCSQVKRVDVPKRRVSTFQKWRAAYRQPEKNEIKR